jgi:hypothetical protein
LSAFFPPPPHSLFRGLLDGGSFDGDREGEADRHWRKSRCHLSGQRSNR